jgi:flavin-dependent dehydrogenase
VTDLVFDALVIGGGPAGATTALLLAKAGWSVGLVEKTSFPRGKVCGEFLSGTNLPLLRHMGLADSFLEFAGPEVRQVGVFTGNHVVTAKMPRPRTRDGIEGEFGRALGRDRLDKLLLQCAASAGVSVWQPWSAIELIKDGDGYLCWAINRDEGESKELRARIVVAAHGSWEPGTLPTQPARPASRPSDVFGFKAHFVDTQLPLDLMPLLSFPDGYAGMVHSDHGRVSLSCCIRRDRLESARRAAGPVKAGEAVLAHIKLSCRGARDALANASLHGDWLSSGPIRPGIRGTGFDGIFLVGNAAGEAYPVIAEGIGMAMQSAYLLCEFLTAESVADLSRQTIDAVRSDYATAWRQAIAPRIRAAALISHWAMKPTAVACVLPLLRMFPRILTAGARMSGKATAAHTPLEPAPSLTS